MKQLEDKLKSHRTTNADDKTKFYQWLEKNCLKATSPTEVRQILRNIKKPIRKVVNE